MTTTPTVRKQASARPHIFRSACPSPGTSHAATPMTKAMVSRLEFCCAAAGATVSSAIHLPLIPGSCQQRQNLVLNRPCHAGFVFPDIYIHFTSHAEFWKINSRLNRIARVRDQVPHVLRFEPVHIHAVAVHSFSDAVPGPVKEIFPVTGFFDYPSRRFVHLPSLQWLSCRDLLAN